MVGNTNNKGLTKNVFEIILVVFSHHTERISIALRMSERSFAYWVQDAEVVQCKCGCSSEFLVKDWWKM